MPATRLRSKNDRLSGERARGTVAARPGNSPLRARNVFRGFRRAGGEEGAVLVEFALSITLLLTLVIGIMQTSFALYFYNVLNEAAREGTRYAIVRGSEWAAACGSYGSYDCTASSTDVSNFVNNLGLSGINSDVLGPNGVTTAWAASPNEASCQAVNCNGSGDRVTVTVSYPFTLKIPFVPSYLINMSSTSTMTVLY